MTAYILNLFDLVCTLYALNFGAEELNPLMQNVYFMIFYKIVVIGVLLLWLGSRQERIAKVGLLICTAAYALLAVYHIFYAVSILRTGL